MNIKRLFFGFAFLMTIQVNAQNYLISFAGTGAATTVSQVKVENLTAGTTLTVNKGEILRLIGTGGLGTIDNKQYSIKIYPNPMTGSNAVLLIYPPDPGNAIISIFDLAGRIEAQLVSYLGNYPQEYRLSGFKNGLHLISVTGKTYHFSGRLLCAGEAAGTISIERITSNNPGDENIAESAYIRDNTTVNMPYTYGDRLKFTGISKIYSTVKTDIPEADKTITFNFIPCTDGDKNNYPIVEIGSQVWMARNLKTTKYNNGSPIEYPGSNSKSWNSNTSGAFAWYDDDMTKYEDVYGALYNWHAVSTGNLCPVGWHVPDNEDWIILTEFLGGMNIAGEKIKETGNLHWGPTNIYSSNESGFTAVPGGFRNLKTFTELKHYGYMWSSGAGSKTTGARGWYINSISEGLNESDMNYLNEGLSVRCILGESGSIPVVSTDAVTDITTNSANCGCTINSDGGETVTGRGICWSTSQDPTLSDYVTSDTLATDKFIISLSGLLPETTYHIRAYATNNSGTAYGNDVSFITGPIVPPILSTTEVSSVTSATASSGGTIIDDGGGQITIRGICWAATSSPSLSDYQTSNGAGIGSFSSDMTGLLPGTTYYVRAYAVNSAGTAYGNEITFTASAVVPVITTATVINITRTAATSGGNITSDGGSPVNVSGVCWGTSHYPSIEGAFTTDGTLTGTFASNISGLIPGTIYYIRAYATNSAGTAYGDEVTFTTNQMGLAVLTTTDVSSVTSVSAVSGGNITDDGEGKITVRGICWSTAPAPSITDNITANGKGTGSFTSNITGLMPGTSYHVRAYATNSAGTSYGNDITFTTDAVTPTITTTAVYNVTRTTANSGGNITSNGGAVVTTSGICWGTSHNPSIAGSHTNDGTLTGNFTSSLTSLVPNTLYYVRAYATNTVGTGYGNEVSFTTNPIVPATLTTTAVSSVTSVSASSGGNITDDGDGAISARGICWATTPAPTISDSKTTNGTGKGSFTSNITGLLPGTSYHVRAYATNSAGTAYGNDLTFTTDAIIPTIITSAAYNITRTTATSGGNITSNGGTAITVSGVCWGTSHNPSIAGSHTNDGTLSGNFTSSLTSLVPNTLYYVRAYATNSTGTGYGNEVSFTTNPIVPATLTTTAVSSVTSNSASSGGNITDDGDGAISARGICWATAPAPTISDSKTTNGTGTGSFTSSLTGLLPGTSYHVRAYATNIAGTAYGNDLTFTTDAIIPTIITAAAYNITRTTATSGGSITSNGGSAITVSGVCWGTSHNPSILGSHTNDGTSSGNFASSLTSLLPNTLYYIRAYAINGAGIAYGNELSFTTNSLVLPTITTTSISSITASTATSGGNITDDGGTPVSARGICWSITATPTIGNDKTTDGTGTGSYSSNMTGLSFETTYYVRAYATNSIGTVYGNQLSFTTTPRPDSDLTFGTSADGSLLLHSVGDKRIILKTIGADNYIKYSSDNGATYNQGIKITGIFTDYNKARILSNGNIVLFCGNKIYYSDNNLATITPCIVQDKDGSPYVLHTPINPAYPGGYFNFMGGFVENDGVAVMGTYTNASMGASPVNLYYSLDGITWKVFYTFGQNPNYTDNGTAQGGTGGTLLGDPNNPTIARHIHAVNIGQDGNFYACTGDWNTEIHILKCSYDKLSDTWSTIDLLSDVSRTWQRMRALGVYERNGYLYWGSDGPGTFIYNGVQYDCFGIYKCAVADINDASKHILLKPLSDACYSFLNVDHIVFAGMQSYGSVYISYDYGETWSEYTKPGWFNGTVQGVWYNQLYKYLVNDWGVIIKSILF